MTAAGIAIAVSGSRVASFHEWPAWPWLAVSLSDSAMEWLRDVLVRRRSRMPPSSDPSRPAPDVPRDLPPPRSDFIEPKEALAFLRHHMLRNDAPLAPAPLIAIHGQPGTGKSALAIYLAHEMQASYPDAQLYVDLRGTSPSPLQPLQATEALRRLLRQLDTRELEPDADLDAHVREYRSRLHGRRAIIVLDNAVDESQVTSLLPHSETCLVLITSRRRLDRLTGARPCALGPMSEQESLALLMRVAGDHVSVDNEPSTGRVAELCGRLPLALRIAGIQLRSHQAGDVVSRLEDGRGRLGALYVGDLDVRTSFDVSYERLSDLERALFRRLRLVPEPSSDVAMAATLLNCPPGLAADALDRLVEEQMLLRDDGGRHRFDQLIGLYADEKLDQEEPSDERDAASSRILRVYLAEAMRQAVLLDPAIGEIASGPQPPPAPLETQLAALDWFERERARHRAAWRRAVDLEEHDVTWKLAASLGPLFELRGPHPEWSEMQDAALDAARATGDLCAGVWASLGAGQFARLAGRLAEAQAHLQEAHDRALAGRWPRLRARALYLMGRVQHRSGRLDTALARYDRAAAIFHAEGLLHEHTSTILRVASAVHEQGTIPPGEVLRLGDAALHALERLPEELWTVRTIGRIEEHLAAVAAETGDLETAGAHCIRSHVAYRRIGCRHGQARARRALGQIRTRQRMWGRAREYLEESASVFHAIGDESAASRVVEQLRALE